MIGNEYISGIPVKLFETLGANPDVYKRQKFDRQKVLTGLLKACEKRPISVSKLSELVNRVEAKVSDSPDREISTTEIGEFLMEGLRELDKIAYVRFASVYRDFQDEEAFFNELKNLMRQKLP